MKQREVRDQDNIVWQCVQPLSGSAATEKAAAEKLTDENSNIEIVCTPTKAAQSVRIEVSIHWQESMSDEEILSKINDKK